MIGQAVMIVAHAIGLLTGKGWCQGSNAQDANGCELSNFESPNAVKFCLAGAVLRAESDLGLRDSNASETVWDTLADACHADGGVVGFNDATDRTLPDVLARLAAVAVKVQSDAG